MGLLERLAHLEEQISRYLDLHNNPHDTSVHNKTAEKLLKLLPLIQKLHASTDKDNTSHSKTISGSVGVGGDNKEEDVKAVQTLLEITVDGDCGPKTKAAIKQFQKDNNITPISGTIEPDSPTWKKLAGVDDTGSDHQNDGGNDDSSNNHTISGSVGVGGDNKEEDVKAVQTLLEITVDGDCGPKTKAAIKQFQKDNNITPISGTIEPDSPTWKKLAGVDDTSSDHQNDGGGNDDSSNNHTISGSVGVGGDNKEEDVKAVQTLLEITVDGDCGPKTKAAIKQFQKDNNITPISGTIEPDSPTWKKLAGVDDTGSDHQNDGGNDNTPVTNRKIDNSVGADACNDEHDVRVVQTLMNENGYELTVNGTADDELTQYLKDFQRRKEQNPTGLVEPNDDTFVFLTGQTPEDDHPTITIDVNDTLQKSVGLGGKNETADVALVQKLLRDEWGYDVPVDGDPQDSTIQAIRQFQHRFAGMINRQDVRIDPGGTTIKYLTGASKPVEGYTEDGIIGGVETELEQKMGEFTRAFSGVRVEVRPDEWVAVRPPYHINKKHRKRNAEQERKENPKVGHIANRLGFGGNVGKATLVQIEDFLNQCLAAKLVPESQKNSKGLNEFLAKYGVSMDCSGLAIQAANFLLQDDLERNKHNQDSEDVQITNTRGIQSHPEVSKPTNLRAGDMMVNYKREGTGTYHVRVVVDVDIEDDHVAFTTVESASSTTMGDGGHGVGQRRWKCPNKTNYDNLQILLGNNWQTAGRSDQAYTYVRMRQLADVEEE